MFSKIRNPQLRAFCKFLASLRLAVVVLLGIGTLSAYGTIVESRYDAITAQKLVYHSWWSYTIFALLSINLTAVIVDRYPWKRRHLSFLFAHVGILLLLGGSLLTRYFGTDGIMRVALADTAEYISLPDTEITLWSMMGGMNPVPLFDKPKEVDFLVRPPSEKRPFDILPGKIQVVGFIPYALRDVKIVPSELPSDGPALRFVLENERASVTDWMVLSSSQPSETVEMGPAKVVFTTEANYPVEGNMVVLRPEGEGAAYTVHTERSGQTRSGFIQAGQSMETGWMDLTFRLLSYHEKARYVVDYRPLARPTPMSVSALKVRFKDQEHLLGLNSNLRLFDDNEVYFVGYGNKRVNLNFGLTLKQFHVGRYQGTMRAASYESLVEVPGEGGEPAREVLISMNEPLKYQGLTFYQSSFEEDEMGSPTHSIFSVNHDPGRWWKYLGSTLVTFGTFLLFYRKARAAPVAKF